MTRIAIIDGGGANLASLQFALGRLGHSGELTTDAATIRAASHVILPGVGAARDAMSRLSTRGLDQLIPTLRQPFLGICLGLQLLHEASDEEDTPCLGVLAGTAHRLAAAPDRSVPHMGWNRVRQLRDSTLFAGLEDESFFYFVHSYAVPVGPATIGVTGYGTDFTAVAEQDNFCATQFHPERSGPAGARLLANFLAR